MPYQTFRGASQGVVVAARVVRNREPHLGELDVPVASVREVLPEIAQALDVRFDSRGAPVP